MWSCLLINKWYHSVAEHLVFSNILCLAYPSLCMWHVRRVSVCMHSVCEKRSREDFLAWLERTTILCLISFLVLWLTELCMREWQVGIQKKKKKISDMTSWNSQVEFRQSVSEGGAVVNQWKRFLRLQLVQTPPLTSSLSFQRKPQSQCATCIKQATEIYLHGGATK